MTNETNQTFEIAPKILVNQLSDKNGLFTLGPLPPGFGATLGNSIRRTLFSIEEGYAISAVQVYPAVQHEFASIEGIVEDVQEIILNLKTVRLRKINDIFEEKIRIHLQGTNIFKAEDITKASCSFETLDPSLVICNMDEKVNIEIELTVTKGRGYIPAQDHKPEKQEYGVFVLDAIYSPIVNVKVNIENTLVGKRTDYEKLIIEIDTDGSIAPDITLKNAARVLRDVFVIIVEEEIEKVSVLEKQVASVENNRIRINKLLDTPLGKLGLSARVVNSLNANNFECLKDIVGKQVADLLLLPNFGKKCLQDLEEFLRKENISWDVDVQHNVS